jgi:hypothetical protein
MRVALAAVGAFLALDAGITLLMLAFWAARGHMPDFVGPTAFGVWGITTVMLKTVGGAIGAAQLWRLKQGGRPVAGLVLANNAFFTIAAAARAGVFDGRVWGTLVLNAALLALVALPAPAVRGGCRTSG